MSAIVRHVHKAIRRRESYCSSGGGTADIKTCVCGAERHVCWCRRCTEQELDEGPWMMPKCDCCGLRHPLDQSCGTKG